MTATLAPSSTTTGITLSIARGSLKTALGKLAAAVDSSVKAHAVAQHIRFDVVPGRLTLTATDFEAFVRLHVTCDASGQASALLPAKRLAEIVNALPPVGAVTLVFTLTKATVTAGRSRFELPTMSVEDFPPLPVVDTRLSATVHATTFLDAIDRAVSHASTEDARPALNVVRLEPGDGPLAGSLLVIGLDGHRLARLSGGAAEGIVPSACSLHRSTPPLLARLFTGLPDEARITLAIDEHRLIAETDTATAIVRLVALSFPDHRPVVANVSPTRVVVVDRLLFSAAVRRVGLVTPDSRRILVTVGEEITLQTADATKGTAVDVVTISETRLGDTTPLTLAMHAGWTLDALDTLTTPEVALAIDSPVKPVIFRAADAASDATLVLAQPLRLEV